MIELRVYLPGGDEPFYFAAAPYSATAHLVAADSHQGLCGPSVAKLRAYPIPPDVAHGRKLCADCHQAGDAITPKDTP